jgi:hypothetical protein
MARGHLAPVAELYEAPEDKQAFERSRSSVSLANLAEVVENRFTLRETDWSALFSYVSKHWEALPILLDAPDVIREVFGDVRPILDFVNDPEEGWEELFIVIPVREPAPKALERLERLDSVWFTDAARGAKFALNVTVERDV